MLIRLAQNIAIISIVTLTLTSAAQAVSSEPVASDAVRDVRHLETWLVGAGDWAWLVSIGLFALHTFVPFPAELLAVANGMFFGIAGGAVVTWIGGMCGAWLGFGVARWLGRPALRRFLGDRRMALVDARTQTLDVPVLLTSRLLPVISFNIVNFAAGLTSVSWWTFSWTTAIGILPVTILSVAFGGWILSTSMREWGIGALLVGFAVIFLCVWFLRLRKG